MPGAVGGLVEEVAEVVELAEAELEGEQAVGSEGFVGGGDEAAVDVEAGGAGEEGGVGFVLEDLLGHGGGFVEGDVGRVGDDDVEGWGGFELGCVEEIGLEEDDAVAEGEAAGVVLGDGERGGVEVGGGDEGVGEMGGESEGDGSGAGADVEDAGSGEGGTGGDPVEDGFDEELGLGARDEGVGGDAEVEAVELVGADEVLDGLFGAAAGDEGAEGGDDRGGKLVAGVRDEPGAVAEEDVREESVGFAARDLGGGFGEGFAEGHEGRG